MELKTLNDMHYWLYTPEKPGKNKPLVIFLHGAGERGGSPENVFRISLPLWLRNGKWKPDAYVICPQCREGWDWTSQVERIKAIIDYEAQKLQSDRTRISITGLSALWRTKRSRFGSRPALTAQAQSWASFSGLWTM